MTIEARPIDGPVGAEIVGIDTRQALSDDEFRVIEGALFDHVAVVISDIEENVDWLLDLGQRFGPLVPHVVDQYHHPKTPEISVIAANTGGPESRSTFRPAGAYWHSDLSYMAEPSDAILLYSIQIPSVCGDTLVANMARAYEVLPQATKDRIDRWVAVHRYGKGGGGADAGPARQCSRCCRTSGGPRPSPHGQKCSLCEPRLHLSPQGHGRGEEQGSSVPPCFAIPCDRNSSTATVGGVTSCWPSTTEPPCTRPSPITRSHAACCG